MPTLIFYYLPLCLLFWFDATDALSVTYIQSVIYAKKTPLLNIKILTMTFFLYLSLFDAVCKSTGPDYYYLQ